MGELVSIIVPVYNNEEYIGKCLTSLICQTYKNIEIIVIDDGSNKSTAKICDKFERYNQCIRVYHKPNGGVSSARNLGLKKSNGCYIAFVDSDDWVEPNFIECLITNMEKKRADLSVINLEYEVLNKKSHKKGEVITTVREVDFVGIWKELLYSTKTGGFLCNKLFKKELITKLLDENLYYSEDFVFTAEYCRGIKKAVISNEILYHYRQNSGNATSDYTYNKRILTLLNSYQRLEKIYAECAPDDLDSVIKNTLKIALNLRSRYKFNKIEDMNSYNFIQKAIYSRIKYVIKSKKVNVKEKVNILFTYSFPQITFKVKNFILGRKI